MKKRGTPEQRRETPRATEREELAKKWAENRDRHVPPGGPPQLGAESQYFADLRERVSNWNRKISAKGEAIDAKDINGSDVIEVLELAGALTNDPAYREAIKSMRLHRLERGGLRRAFQDLQRRHGHVDDQSSLFDMIETYQFELGLEKAEASGQPVVKESVQRATEHAVAATGFPGASFATVVDTIRHAFEKREQRDADEQQYLAELHGLPWPPAQ